MASFNLDILGLEQNIENYLKYRKDAKDDLNHCYSIFSNLDYAWDDSNLEIFKDYLAKDKKNINDYFHCIGGLYKEMETFKDNIKSLLSSYGCQNKSKLHYDSSRIQNCLNYISYAIGDLNDVISYIAEKIVYPSNFVYLELVNEILREIYWLKNDLDNCDDTICNLSNSILSELDESRNRISKLDRFTGKFDVHTFTWQNIHLDNLSKMKKLDIGSVLKSNSIQLEGEVSLSGKYSNLDTVDSEKTNVEQNNKNSEKYLGFDQVKSGTIDNDNNIRNSEVYGNLKDEKSVSQIEGFSQKYDINKTTGEFVNTSSNTNKINKIDFAEGIKIDPISTNNNSGEFSLDTDYEFSKPNIDLASANEISGELNLDTQYDISNINSDSVTANSEIKNLNIGTEFAKDLTGNAQISNLNGDL